MTDVKMSDTTGRTMKMDQAYKVTVKSYGNGVSLELDTEWNPEIKALVSLARQNGCQWFKWTKDANTEKLKKIVEEKDYTPN